MIVQMLLPDLIADLPAAVRLQRLVHVLREAFACGAVVLLQREGECLRPIAATGLVQEALGRRFEIARHPRLAALLSRREPTWFEPDSPLPDPYDGLLDSAPDDPLPVHDCMGVSLYMEGELWGALTFDALQAGTFDERARQRLQQLLPLIETTLRITRLEQDNRALRLHRGQEVQAQPSQQSHNIIGASPAISRLLDELRVVADSDLPVLLSGETGVGKELFAHWLHRHSARASQPLVQVNCAALPETLAESELFGHVRGAFSGATGDRGGRFDAADGGTLFLDEIGELPLALQAKLLRALQNGEIQRLGADQPLRVDVRIIAASNRNLADSVAKGDFRADLYHRLSVYPVPIPPLRERGNDVLLLAGHFLEQNRTRLGLRGLHLTADAEQALLGYHWPGNVRELEHVISRAAIKALGREGSRQALIGLNATLLDIPSMAAPIGADPAEAEPQQQVQPLRQAVEALQRQQIRLALEQSDQNWSAAARALGLDASNLHKLAARLGIKAGDSR
ncbi:MULTISPECIES: nitric oxide reductase transcriptional regulator NorR [Pseudomonas]|uniref:Nitric oxide reductase transcriptional regulator NorR n=1 Tax=Pseudomonas abyssi TaxID=170540 RepID=A0A2A3MG60_9PSED|nr:nitric oxide reductase transcriptional regulator NorR [Pseudomonas abyssi]MAD01820.1 nitric oxide reductase transcriptional regulator NorR [Pseudomonadales bacterium]PBK03799.1 nitric oxide reductase transcriptional regulator NorR [Pseudomonas abyssi]